MVEVRVTAEQTHTGRGGDGLDDGLYHLGTASVGIIRNAFDESVWHRSLCQKIRRNYTLG
jgi:hypothetical protein